MIGPGDEVEVDTLDYTEMSDAELKERAQYDQDEDAIHELDERDCGLTNEEAGLDENGNRDDD